MFNRIQYVSVLGENSDKLLVEYGVPQGSVLGPLIFIMYINDICNSAQLGKFVLFADDTNIFITDKCIKSSVLNHSTVEFQDFSKRAPGS